MVIDLRRCHGCLACQVACKSENVVPLGVWRGWVRVAEFGVYPNAQRGFLSRLCNHCENPICVRNCPTGASYQREDGTVLIDYQRCIGCRYCIASCPYRARFFHPELRTADKCTFCAHRLERGLEPACVNTCVARARVFGDLNDPESEISQIIRSNNVQVLGPETGLRPSVFYLCGDTRILRDIQGR